MEFELVMNLNLRFLKAGVVVLLLMQLTGCIEEDEVSPDAAASAGELTLEFTNPAGTDAIATPDIVINIAGTVTGAVSVENVAWRNDRGGQGYADGKESWVTGDIVLQLGTNIITVTAMDSFGAQVSRMLTVERENTASSANDSEPTGPELLFSYKSDLSDAAPVESASILQQPVNFFIQPSSEWINRGIESIRINCCKGVAGPGDGEGYTTGKNTTHAPWSRSFDMSGFRAGGTRRMRVTATFNDGSNSDSSVFDFLIASSGNQPNSAPLISGDPSKTATSGVQYSFRPSAQDSDGDTMQFSIANKPAWSSFSSTTGRLFGTPSVDDVGRHDNIIISVSDGQESTALPAFAIDVEAVSAGSATLTWSIPTERMDNTPLGNELAGFNVYYGQASGDYSNKVVLDNSGLTTYMVDNLSNGQWYFIVTAFDSDGLESNPSNEGQKTF